MPDLLLELFSEEIPARMQTRAADDLRRMVTDGLVAAGLTYAGARAFATPRRLALTVQGLTVRSADVREERKGPRVGAPAQALDGFLRVAGLASIEEATVQSDAKKGDFYVAVVTKPGRAAEEIIADLVPEVIRTFPWPKSMRWGARSAPAGSPLSGPDAEGAAALRWVRPLRSIVCTFGPETEEPVVIPIEVSGIRAGDVTFGHRFMAGGDAIRVRRFDDYVEKLGAAKVVLDAERRKAIIETEARNLAFAQGLDLVADPALVDEVAGLVEWPVVLMGAFDERFLDIPDEVIRLTIRQNQKCFVLRGGAGRNFPLDPSRPPAGEPQGEGSTHAATHSPHPEVRAERAAKDGGHGPAPLTNRFVLVSNLEASDGGAAIVAGNERVIRARLSDARFFWEQDQRIPLEKHAEKLATITFHEKLGSQAERVERIARLAHDLAPLVGADPDEAERAARLAKADLVTGMVGEFPDLQGVMGRYYFLAENGLSNLSLEGRSRAAEPLREGGDADTEPPHSARPADAGRLGLPLEGGDTGGGQGSEIRVRSIADAIRDHYKPAGPSDAVPTEPVSVAVALADKLDTLVGFWAIDEKPTGSKDPFALRRAALGVIRIVLENGLSHQFVRLGTIKIYSLLSVQQEKRQQRSVLEAGEQGLAGSSSAHDAAATGVSPVEEFARKVSREAWSLYTDLLAFFADRLKVHLREQGARHDLIDAVFALPGQDDLLLVVRRVEALGRFLESEDGANLLTGYRRAANILRAEEKKDGEEAFRGAPDPDGIALPEEEALFAAMAEAERDARAAVDREDFGAAMTALARLRPAVDTFFDKVTVNADDPAVRVNRLRLLNRLREATLAVADFSRIGG